MPFQIPILCYDSHVGGFGQTLQGGDPRDSFAGSMPGSFCIEEAPVSDSTEEVPMTPGVIAQQNGQNAQSRILNLQGLVQSPSPWDLSDQVSDSEKNKKKAERERSKRQILAQQQREEQERLKQREDSDRRYRSYMAAVATEELQSRIKGEPMNPESLAGMLHAAGDALTGGITSAIHGITADHAVDAVKGEDESSRDRKEEDLSTSPLHRPLRTD